MWMVLVILDECVSQERADELDARQAHALTRRPPSSRHHAVVQNGSPFTYFNDRPLNVADDSRLDNGTLAGAVLHRASPLDLPTFLVRFFAGPSVTGHRRVTGFSGLSDVRVRSLDGRAIPLEVDGDWLGDVTEADFGVTPGGLTVIA